MQQARSAETLEAQVSDSVGDPAEAGPVPFDDPSRASHTPDYGELGERVAGVLASADEAAHQVRAEAEEEAAAIRQRAEEDGARQRQEAAEHQAEVERVAQRTLAKAEEDAVATRAAAEQAAREIEEAVRERQNELREETRSLAEQRRQALWEVQNIASQLQNVILRTPLPRVGEQSPVEDGGPNSAGATTRELVASTDEEEAPVPSEPEAREEESVESHGAQGSQEQRHRLEDGFVGNG